MAQDKMTSKEKMWERKRDKVQFLCPHVLHDKSNGQ